MATNPDQTALATLAKYATPANFASNAGAGQSTPQFAATDPRRLDLSRGAGGGQSTPEFAATDPRRLDVAGGQKPQPTVAKAKFQGQEEDMRVRIKVPAQYLGSSLTTGYQSALAPDNIHGIIFPYTPSINFEVKADYAPQVPTHSNFSINFYKNSSVGSINITGKFSVANELDAKNYISTMHLLRTLTRMKFGPDPDAGAPPPVCRLFAYGEMQLYNVPVAIVNYRVELPDNVDYFSLESGEGYGRTSVPTISNVSVTCLPMYSRNEMLGYSSDSYTSSMDLKRGGFV